MTLSTAAACHFSQRIPDEILLEIFSYSEICTLDDSVIVDNNALSDNPLAWNRTTALSITLTCRVWAGVATPLLYNTIMLRTRRQAKALQHALHQSPFLGKRIRKLRIEADAYCPALSPILKRTGGLTHLALTLDADSKANVASLVDGLKLVNPSVFVLRNIQTSRRLSKPGHKLMNAICSQMPQWSNLTTLIPPFDPLTPISLSLTSRARQIAHAANQVTTLKTMHVRRGACICFFLELLLIFNPAPVVEQVFSRMPFMMDLHGLNFLAHCKINDTLRTRMRFPVPGPYVPEHRSYLSIGDVGGNAYKLIWCK